MAEPAVELIHVSKSFGSHKVLDDVSMRIETGRTTVLVGPSGTGKSVLLKHIVGLLLPDAGEVRIFGQDITHMRERDLIKLRRRFGMLFQDGALFGSMSVGDNIAFPLRHHTDYSPTRIREIVAAKLAMVELPGIENRLPAELSGGGPGPGHRHGTRDRPLRRAPLRP